jgi:phage terminase large subunit GpA-like protein
MRFPDSLPRTDDGQERKLDAVFFDQLTAEKKKIKYVSGTPRYYWDCPKGKRNEVLDCTVYATAALNILNPNLKLLAKEKKILGGNYQRSQVRSVQRRIYSQGVTV